MKQVYVEREKRTKRAFGSNCYKRWGGLGGGAILHRLSVTGQIHPKPKRKPILRHKRR